jgi:hypothetical protein
MNIDEVLDLVKQNIVEDALDREAIWKKNMPTKNRIEKGKGEEIKLRKLGKDTEPEERAEKYVNRMKKGHTNSRGKEHKYDTGKILKGLGPTYKNISDESIGATPRFNIFKKLAERGELTRRQITRSSILTDGEKEKLYDIIEKGKEK